MGSPFFSSAIYRPAVQDPSYPETKNHNTSPIFNMAGHFNGDAKAWSLDEHPSLTLQPLDPPNREDWERFKPTIVGKYLGMNAPLHEIVREMEHWYGFRASKRMYKQRFTDWNVFKYKKAAEKRIAQDRSIHKGSTYDYDFSMPMSRIPSSMTSTSFPMDDLDFRAAASAEDGSCDQSARCAHRRCIQTFFLHLERQYINVTGLYQPDVFPSNLRCHPQRIGSVEKVLNCIRQFTKACMAPDSPAHQDYMAEASAEAAQITSGLIGHCSHRSSPKQCERCTWAEFDFGLAMLEDQHTDLALASFELGCRLVHLLLSSPSKLFIRNLIMAFGSTRWEPFEPFRQKLLEYLASMASVVLGDSHPITITLDNVACNDTFAASAEPALRIVLELFQQTYRSAHPDILLIKRSLSVILRRQRDYEAGEQILLSAIHDSEQHNGHDCKETRRCLRRLGHLYMEQGRYREAEAVFQRILDTAPGKSVYQDNWIPDEISVYTYQHLARMANDMGDQDKCRFWFTKELDAAIRRWGIGGEYTAECLQLAYNEIPLDALGATVNQYPNIFNQAEIRRLKGSIVISKARWCAVRVRTHPNLTPDNHGQVSQ